MMTFSSQYCSMKLGLEPLVQELFADLALQAVKAVRNEGNAYGVK